MFDTDTFQGRSSMVFYNAAHIQIQMLAWRSEYIDRPIHTCINT